MVCCRVQYSRFQPLLPACTPVGLSGPALDPGAGQTGTAHTLRSVLISVARPVGRCLDSTAGLLEVDVPWIADAPVMHATIEDYPINVSALEDRTILLQQLRGISVWIG